MLDKENTIVLKLKTTRTLSEEPIRIKADHSLDGKISAVTVAGESREFPAVCEDGVVTAVLTLPAGEHELTVVEGESKQGVVLNVEDGRVDVIVEGNPFTSYVWNSKLAKPYLGPVLSSFGSSFTRLDFTAKEHPHHRSVFFGVGDVTLEREDAGENEKNVDFWNEPQNCGIQRHMGIENVRSNGAYSAFTAKTQWCSHDGRPMIDAECEYKFYPQSSECRYVDLTLTYRASYGDVSFGKTKEAGPLGVRMADPLRADAGGRISNSYGAKGESECWGRSANWCVYEGELSGHDVGIAVYDNPDNERYPTTWHVRDYGLFAANNLYFRGGLRIEEGCSLTYKYRIIFFEGTSESARIKERFITYLR